LKPSAYAQLADVFTRYASVPKDDAYKIANLLNITVEEFDTMDYTELCKMLDKHVAIYAYFDGLKALRNRSPDAIPK